jgi:hypothetical protein
MIKLLEIQEKLRDTTAAIAQLERAVVKEPNSFSLKIMAESLKKRQSILDAEYATEADNLGVDICTYRIFSEKNRQTLRALVQTLGNFQTLVSTVYDSVKSKTPKMRARISDDILTETEFNFGYVFSGSVGIVLTIPNKRFLGIESELDESIAGIGEMTKARDPSEVLEFSRKFGGASIRALYIWAHDNDELGLSTGIEWKRNQVIRSQLLTQQPEFKKLHETISQLSDVVTTQLELTGTLWGVELSTGRFHLISDNGDSIKGSLENIINEKQTAELPTRYRATIIKREQMKYSTEQPVISYHLTKLERL